MPHLKEMVWSREAVSASSSVGNRSLVPSQGKLPHLPKGAGLATSKSQKSVPCETTKAQGSRHSMKQGPTPPVAEGSYSLWTQNRDSKSSQFKLGPKERNSTLLVKSRKASTTSIFWWCFFTIDHKWIHREHKPLVYKYPVKEEMFWNTAKWVPGPFYVFPVHLEKKLKQQE